jgi:hypothetical protein
MPFEGFSELPPCIPHVDQLRDHERDSDHEIGTY